MGVSLERTLLKKNGPTAWLTISDGLQDPPSYLAVSQRITFIDIQI